MKLKVAVCLYGQFRTGEYCLPWIVEQYKFGDAKYYAHVKTYSTYANTVGSKPDVKSKDKIEAVLRSHLGNDLSYLAIVDYDEERLVPKKGHWHYAPMFSSMQQAAYAAFKANASTNVDWVVLQRLDVLIGPQPDTLSSRLFSQPPDLHTVYTINANMRFEKEGGQHGIHDVYLAGSLQSMNLLVAETFPATANPQATDWQRFAFEGPNVFLRKAAQTCGLHVRQLPVEMAIVRPTADLATPAFQSFKHHESTWHQDHKGMKNGHPNSGRR